MKKCYLYLFLFLFSGLAFAQENITVQASTVIKDVSNHPIGINVDYLMDDDTYLQPETSTASALQEMGVKFLRFPGGEKSDNYIWGQYPYTSANHTLALTDTCHWPNSDPRFVQDDYKSLKPTTLDFDEFMKMVQATGTEPLIVVNGDGFHNTGGDCGSVPARDSLLMAARQWVRYANIVKKYNIKYWMIGNESYHSAAYDGAVSATDYLNDLIDFAQAMKAEDPSIKIVVNGLSDSWWKTILSNSTATGLIDYLGISVYPINNWAKGYDYYRTSSPDFTKSVSIASNAITKYVTNATDRQRIKVIATEYNTIDWAENGWANKNDVGHALVAFDMLGKLLQIPKLELAFFWNTRYVDNREIPFNVYDALSSTGSLQANGLALSVWGKYLLDSLVAVNSTASIVSYASKSATGLNVFLLNKDNQAHAVNLTINDFATTGTAESYTYQGKSILDTIPVLAPSPPVASLPDDASQFALQVAPASITILKFIKAPENNQTLISNVSMSTGKRYTVTDLAAGKFMYIDRTYKITSVPSPLAEASLIQTANDDKNSTSTSLLSFYLSEEATVYVAYDPRATALPSWLSGWQKSNDSLGVNDSKISSMNLYSKTFEAGKVTLGGNIMSPAKGAENNYIVLARAGQPLSAGKATAENKQKGINLRIFPNPNTGSQIWIELNDLKQNEQVAITLYKSVLGREFFKYSIRTNNSGAASFKLPLKQPLTPGLYLIQAVAESGQKKAKLLIIQ